MVEFSLTPRQKELQKAALTFALTKIAPSAEKSDLIADPAKSFDWSLVREASRLGLRTLSMPKEYGGENADVLTLAVVGEALAQGDLGFAVAIDQTVKIIRAIVELSDKQLLDRWMPKIVDDPECLLGVGATEPMAGSDNLLPYDAPGAGMQMYAEKKGDKWIINGTKRYISNGGLAKYFYIMARTDRTGLLSKSCTGFFVPADAPGFTCTEVWDKMGQRCVQNGTLELKNVEIPDRDRIGEVGSALPALGVFLLGFGSNIQAGATVLGVAQRAYDLTLQYAMQRQQGGKRVIDHDLQRQRLAHMAMRLQAARSYLWYAAWDCKQPTFDPKHASLSKVFAAQAANDVVMQAFELWAATGYMKKNPMEKLVRDALSFIHSDGTNDVLSLKAARFIAAGEPDPSSMSYSKRVEDAAQGR